MNKYEKKIIIPDDVKGLRLDQALAKLLPEHSRSQIQTWIKNNEINLNGQHPKTRTLVQGGEVIEIHGSEKETFKFEAENIPLDVIYEDDSFIVINKPVGMVVHPAAGHFTSTLLNALLHHAPELKAMPRAGIIHRLDKDTSGLLVIAKTTQAMTHLTRQMKARKITRIYQAVVMGVMTSGGTVDAPIARHPILRKQMAIVAEGKSAISHYRVIERYRSHTRIKVQLETGRTHQIRVHMAHIRFPIVGDSVYGGRLQLPRGASSELITALRGFKRQALHAIELTLKHPVTHEEMTFKSPLPDDLVNLIKVLENEK